MPLPWRFEIPQRGGRQRDHVVDLVQLGLGLRQNLLGVLILRIQLQRLLGFSGGGWPNAGGFLCRSRPARPARSHSAQLAMCDTTASPRALLGVHDGHQQADDDGNRHDDGDHDQRLIACQRRRFQRCAFWRGAMCHHLPRLAERSGAAPEADAECGQPFTRSHHESGRCLCGSRRGRRCRRSRSGGRRPRGCRRLRSGRCCWRGTGSSGHANDRAVLHHGRCRFAWRCRRG